jgi:hypothetical protein
VASRLLVSVPPVVLLTECVPRTGCSDTGRKEAQQLMTMVFSRRQFVVCTSADDRVVITADYVRKTGI